MLRHLVRATALSLYGASALAAAPASTGCPARAIQCKADDFSLCKPNALLDFYTPGLPTTGDRNAAPADFEADRFESADRTKYVLEGKAKINRVDQQVQGDRLTYWTETTAWLAEGNVRYQDAGLLMSASKGQGTTTPNTATMTDVRYQMLNSRGNGTAAEAKLIDADHATMQKVEFTTCDPDDVRWRFTAKDMAIDQAEGIARGHDVTLRIGNTPILWLPYARFPISDERQSGFLYPSFGYNNRAGIDFTLPYYLNLAPNYDATLYPRILGQRGLLAGAEFRYLTDRHRGQLEFTYMPHDRDADRERGYFHFNNFSALASNWNFSANLNHVSDKRYFEDFGDSLSTVSTALLPSNAYFNGSGRGWTASIGGDRYQITDPSLGDQFEPYRRLPRGTFEGELGLLGGLRGGIKSEFVSFYKECAKDSRTLSGDNILCPPNGERLDLYPYLNLPLEGAAWFLRPEVGVRYTRYDVTQNAWSTVENTADRFRYRNDSPKRTTPITSVDAGLIFERDTNLFGTAYTQTLEPRLFYLYVPYRNQDDLPIFDTQPLSFDF
ncbi:MAG TPA: LPS assembly protein LptD, partial [Tahibacter sp.]|nr:LPS assembly protein LptD [Tahibacter sp.]